MSCARLASAQAASRLLVYLVLKVPLRNSGPLPPPHPAPFILACPVASHVYRELDHAVLTITSPWPHATISAHCNLARCTELLPQESYFPRDGVADMFFPAAPTCAARPRPAHARSHQAAAPAQRPRPRVPRDVPWHPSPRPRVPGAQGRAGTQGRRGARCLVVETLTRMPPPPRRPSGPFVARLAPRRSGRPRGSAALRAAGP